MNRNDPAFAQPPGSNSATGLTKREYLAVQIAQAAFERFGDETPDPVQVAKIARAAVQFADAVIDAVNS